MSRIGIFAGTFDPIHEGHIQVILTALKDANLEKIYLGIEEKPWSNKTPISIHHRRAMVDLATSKYSNIEVLELPDRHFTIVSTLHKLQEKFTTKELVFIFGGDVFMNMDSKHWPGLSKLLKYKLAVFERGDINKEDIVKHANVIGVNPLVLPSGLPRHSSSQVRLKPHLKTVYVSREIAKYIDDNKLY